MFCSHKKNVNKRNIEKKVIIVFCSLNYLILFVFVISSLDMMADNDPQLDKENTQFHQDEIRQKSEFAPNDSGATKAYCAFLPKFIIPQLKVPHRVTDMPNTGEVTAAQEEQHRIADAHNEMLLNEIKRRREQSDNLGMGMTVPMGLSSFSVPKLRTPSGQTLDKPQFNIPLLNKLRSQNNSFEVTQLERDVTKLKITPDDFEGIQKQPQQQEPPAAALIDLTKTVIVVQKDALLARRQQKYATGRL